MTLQKYIKKFIVCRIFFLVLRYFLTCVNIIIGCFILSILIDKILPLPIIFFHIYWFLIIALVLVFFVHLMYRIIEVVYYPYVHLRDELIRHSKLHKKDDVVNSYLLEANILKNQNINFSKELAENFINRFKNTLFSVDFQKIVGFDKIKKVIPINIVAIVLFCVLYFLPPYFIKTSIHKIIFTRRENVLGIFVLPKDIKIPYKSSVEIKVIVEKEYLIYEPELFIKFVDDKKFNRINFAEVNSISNRRIYIYRIENVIQPVFYKIKFRGVNTKTYTIEPIIYPEIRKINIKVIPPFYTNMSPYEINSFIESKYLYGSKLLFRLEINKKITKATINIYNEEREVEIIEDGKHIAGEFIAIKNTEIWFRMYDEDGFYNESIKYNVNVIEDKPPKIEIVSPQEDIIASINSIIPLIYSVKDDISITKVQLVYKIKDKEHKMTIKNYNEQIKEAVEDYFFDLSKLNVNFGDVISYYLIVYDNDTVLGPKYDITPEYKIEIFSYEKEHQSINQDIERFIDKTLGILGKEVELYNTLLNSTTEHIKDLISQHKSTGKDIEKLSNMLSDILNKMYTDPYTSIDTYIEFKNLLSSVENLGNRVNPELINKLSNNQIKDALELQETIIDTLERAAALSKDIMKRQNMENLSNSLNNTLSATKDLLDTLNNLSDKISLEEKTKIFNLLKEIEEKIKKITELIKSTPQELPEEFINQRDIKNIDLSTSMDMLADIYNAISQGDISTAISIAKKFLAQLEAISKRIADFSSSLLDSDISKLKRKLDSIMNNIDELIQQQQQVYQDTKEMDNFRISELLKKQEKLLTIILEKVNFIIITINNILNSDDLKRFPYKEGYTLNSQFVLNRLNEVSSELSQKRLIQTPRIIKIAINSWNKNLELIYNYKNEYVTLSSNTIKISEMLKEIDDLVNLQLSIEYPQKILTKNKHLHEKQKNIISKINDLLNEMRSLGKESFIITLDDLSIVNMAKLEMINSASYLEKFDFTNAMFSQSSAVNLLLELKNKFDAKQNQLQQISKQISVPISSRVQIKSSSAGRYGALTGRVLLPSAKDYKPPRDLREDIIKSLSEKYPEEFQKSIENYYKELLK